MIDVKYKRTVSFTGRNGSFKMGGMVIQPWFSNKTIIIHPLTSRGMQANCNMEIPIEDLPAVISALQEQAKQLST